MTVDFATSNHDGAASNELLINDEDDDHEEFRRCLEIVLAETVTNSARILVEYGFTRNDIAHGNQQALLGSRITLVTQDLESPLARTASV